MSAIELTRSDLDRHIEETVARNIEKSADRFEKAIDSLRAELSGPARAEQLAESRDKARRDFAALSPDEQRARTRIARSTLFDGSIRDGAPDELKRGGWGKGALFVRFLLLMQRAQREVGGGGQAAYRAAIEIANRGGNSDLAGLIEQRVLQVGDASGAGAFVPEEFSTDFIAALYNSTVVRRAGAMSIDISATGSQIIGRQNTTATANWIGENATNDASQGGFGQLKLDAKKLGVFVPVSNDAIRYANGSFNALVAQDMLQVAAVAEDTAFIRGSGSNGQPKGIKNWVASGQGFAADTAGATAYAKQITDLLKAQYKVEGSNVPIVNPAWFLNPREKFGLMKTLTADSGSLAFFPEMVMNATLLGVPFYATNSIPKNVGDGDESELYFVEMSQCVIGDALRLEIMESEVASYVDANSAQRNSFQTDERVIRLLHQVDFALRHDKAAAYVQDADYGTSLDS